MTMRLKEAMELASEIDADSRFELVAVGRFIPLDKLQSVAVKWGCCTLTPDNITRVCWSRGDWETLKQPYDTPRRDAKHLSGQGTLF